MSIIIIIALQKSLCCICMYPFHAVFVSREVGTSGLPPFSFLPLSSPPLSSPLLSSPLLSSVTILPHLYDQKSHCGVIVPPLKVKPFIANTGAMHLVLEKFLRFRVQARPI